MLMSEIKKLIEGNWYSLVSQPLHPTLLAYAKRANWIQFQADDENPNEIWELRNE